MYANILNHEEKKYQGRIDNYAIDLVYKAQMLLIDLKYFPHTYDKKKVYELDKLCNKLESVLFFTEEK